MAEPRRTCRIEEVVAQELGTPPLRAGNAAWLEHPPGDLFGIALSGGGIRSATFNLGLLQGLSALKLLPAFDYVSTVSGGGYLGSFWTAWRNRQQGRRGAFPGEPLQGESETHEVRHLREFSNFLAPRLGLFSYDTGRMLVTAASSILPSLLAALAVLTLAVLGWIGTCWLLLSPQMDQWSVGTISFLTLVVLAAFEAAWKRRHEPPDGSAYVVATLIGVVVTAAAWYALSGPPASAEAETKQLIARQPIWQDWRQVLAPAAAWAAAFVVLAVGRWFFSRDAGSPSGIRFRRAADRVRSRVLMLAGVWTLGALVWAAGLFLEAKMLAGSASITIPSLGGLTALMAAVFAKAQQVVSRQKTLDGGGRLMALLKPWLPQILAYGVITGLTMGVVSGIAAGSRLMGPLLFPLGIGVGALVVLALVLVCFDPNEVGLHSFYRARLVRAYPGASNNWRPAAAPRAKAADRAATGPTPPSRGATGRVQLGSGASIVAGDDATATLTVAASREKDTSALKRVDNRETEVVEGDDIALEQLTAESARPFHLICCAANDLESADAMAALYRGATSAVLSRVGCSVGGWWRPWGEGHRSPTLGAAMTASAAAFNTLMGAVSARLGPGVTFVAAALNLRLGLWVANPAHPAEPRRPWFPGVAFLREMFGLASASGRRVHLSDGGHFENLAIYELIRRHCRVIVASDCGMDSDSAFDDLGNLVRRVREDFGVEVQLDTGPLKPGADGLSRQHMVAGDIHYPDGDTGVLLLFKPVLVGNEPVDVAQYRRRNPVFPHESTGDQFYDEAQWESYRRLGLHAAHTSFRPVLEGLQLCGSPSADMRVWMEVFGRARREWQPKPMGFDDRLSHFADRVAELDDALRQGGAETLLNQVYKELDELDRRKIPYPPKLYPAPASAAPPAAQPGANGAEAAPLPPVEVVAANGQRSPAPGELSLSLYLIRRALLLMEEVFESENLAASYSHPLYLGLMNWFARWAYAPLFRMWWPLLKTMYPEPFTRFLEKHFSLVAIDASAREQGAGAAGEGMFTWIERDTPGFARTCWLLSGREIPADRIALSYNLRMVYEQRWLYRIQSAQLLADDATAGALIWRAQDFFVPPGLWGVGIGSDFLATLRDPECNQLGGVEALVVQVTADPLGGSPARKRAADEMQLYRTAGFCDAALEHDDAGRPLLVSANCRVVLRNSWAGSHTDHTQWMVAPVGEG